MQLQACGIRSSGAFQIFPDESERRSTVTAFTHFQTAQTPNGLTQIPLAIVAICKRNSLQMHNSIYSIYHACIHNLSGQLLSARAANCGSDFGHCGNYRVHLTECRCKTLDRISNPLIRKIYEDKVIAQAIAIANHQVGNFHLKIAVFASGGLYGEQVLVFRLVESLKKMGCGGLISLFLIDRAYHPAIQQTQQFHIDMQTKGRGSWDGLLGNRLDMKQFVCEISQCLPSSITVECTFFGVHYDYLTAARTLPCFKHHLLIGADIEDTIHIMSEIKEAAVDVNESAVILIKQLIPQNQFQTRQEVAKLCGMGPNKNLMCVQV